MINKYQSGGGMNAFVTYTPFTRSTAQQVSGSGLGDSSSSDKSESKLTDKDLMNMIKEIDGLPSDMQEVINKILQLTMTLNLFGGSSSLNNLTSTYLQALGEVKKATWNKKQYDAAYKIAAENNSLSEIAITADGRVYAQDKDGKPQVVTVDQFMKGGYTPLTNSNLLYMRAHNVANANEMFQVVENGIGMESITKMIQQACDKLGSSELERQGYQSLEAQKGLKVLQEIQSKGIDVLDLMSLNGLYKSKVITKNQFDLANKALEYIWRMLPQNAKTLLAVKSGNTENPTQGAVGLLTNLVTSRTSDEFKFTPEYQENLNSDGSKKKESSSEDIKLNTAQQFIAGMGLQESFPISLGTQSAFTVNSTFMPITKENNPIGANSTLQKVTTSDYGGMMNIQSITMGGKLLNPNALQYVITDGNAHSVDLPIDMKAKETGIIRPDFKALKAMDEADRYIRDNNITNYEEINEIYKSKGVPAKYDQQGNLNLTNYTRFMVVNAQAESKAFGLDVIFDDLYMTEVTDEGEIESFITAIKAANGFKDKEYKFDKMGTWDRLVGGGQHWYSTHDEIYKAPVFIPMNTNVFNSLGQNITPSQMEMILAKLNYVNPGTL